MAHNFVNIISIIFNYFQYPGPHNGLLTSLVFDYFSCFSIIFNDFQNPWTHTWPIYSPYIPHMTGHGSHIWPNVIYGPCMAHNFAIWSNDFQWCSIPLTSYNVNVMAIDFRCLDPIYGLWFSMVFNTLDPITLYVMAIDFQRLSIFYVIFKAPGPIYGHWSSMPGPHTWPIIFYEFQWLSMPLDPYNSYDPYTM